MFFAFAAFAAMDWQTKKWRIISAATLWALIALPWALKNRAYAAGTFPSGYIRALMFYYPDNFRLNADNPIKLFAAGGFFAAVVAVVAWAHSKQARPNPRLEILTLSFVIPVSLGILEGNVFLAPRLIGVQLLRADTFLFLYSAVLLCVAVYLLFLVGRIPFPKVVLPIAAVMLALPRGSLRWVLLVIGIQIALWSDSQKVFRWVYVWLAQHFPFRGQKDLIVRASFGVVILCIYGTLLRSAWSDPRLTYQYSLPSATPSPWSAVQIWARSNTPSNASFLVPTSETGFRVLSMRSSWGERTDGATIYLYPAFATEYLHRMTVLGWHAPPRFNLYADSEEMGARYEQLSWATVLAIARENHLDYIVQYRRVSYPSPAVYENESFAVYAVAEAVRH